MSKSQKTNELTQYTLPRYVDGEDSYIIFYAYHPPTGSMRRKRIKLNYIKTKSMRRKRANEIMVRLVAMLRDGWSPWDDLETVGITVFADALADYKTHIQHDYNIKLLKAASFQTYQSYLKMLDLYLEKHPIRFLDQFDYSFMTAFLDWILYDRQNTARTYNNYCGFLVTLCEFFIKKKYMAENPAMQLKKIPKSRLEKKRDIFTSEDLTELFRRLLQCDKKYLLACYFEYYCMIRPNELWQLRVDDLDLSRQTVTVSAKVSKSSRTDVVTLPRILIDLLLELKITEKPGNYYIFGDKFKTCADPGHKKMFSNYWSRHIVSPRGLFPELKDKNVCFYSLKGTGITNMLENSVPSVVVQRQARHRHLTTTEIYMQTKQIRTSEELTDYR